MLKVFEYSLLKNKLYKRTTNDKVVSIKKIVHPYYGEYLKTQGAFQNSIKIWIITH